MRPPLAAAVVTALLIALSACGDDGEGATVNDTSDAEERAPADDEAPAPDEQSDTGEEDSEHDGADPAEPDSDSGDDGGGFGY